MYENLPLTEAEKANTESLLKAIEKYLTPTVNIRYERALFNLAKQNDDESYDAYINRLRGLIKNCNYGDLENDLLLDKIIYSVKSMTLGEQLWSNQKITLDEAISKCRSKELFAKQMKEVGDTMGEKEPKEEINKIRGQKRYSKSQRSDTVDCGYCGMTHERNKNKCPAFGEKCGKCNLRNHFTKMRKTKQKPYKKLKEIDDDDGDADFVLAITSDKRNLKSEFYMKIGTNKFERTECMLDTGATYNVIGKGNLKQIFQYRDIIVKKTTTKLKSFGGSVIQPIAKIVVECKRKEDCYPIEFEIVEHDHIPLLSAKTCEDMGFIKICSIIQHLSDAKKIANEIVGEFKDVFEGLGCFAGKVKLETKTPRA